MCSVEEPQAPLCCLLLTLSFLQPLAQAWATSSAGWLSLPVEGCWGDLSAPL